MTLQLSHLISFHQPTITQTYFTRDTPSESRPSLLLNVFNLLKKIGADLLPNSSVLLSPLPSSILSEFISFLVSFGIDEESYKMCLPGFASWSCFSPSPSVSPQSLDDFSLTLSFLGYLRASLSSLSSTKLASSVLHHFSSRTFFEVLLKNIKERSVQNYVRKGVAFMEKDQKRQITAIIRTYCLEKYPYWGQGTRKVYQLWTWEVLNGVKGMLGLLDVMWGGCGMEVVGVVKGFVLTAANMSYTTHQWCAEVCFLSIPFFISIYRAERQFSFTIEGWEIFCSSPFPFPSPSPSSSSSPSNTSLEVTETSLELSKKNPPLYLIFKIFNGH